jgi:hypothetical protein
VTTASRSAVHIRPPASLRMLGPGCSGSSSVLALLPSCSLLEQLVSSVGQQAELSVLNAHEPVAEAATNSSVDGVHP